MRFDNPVSRSSSRKEYEVGKGLDQIGHTETMKKALLILVVIAVLGAIGANPRYLEELRLGGGFGDTKDGGADFEKE